MRWDNLLFENDTEQRARLPLFADEAVVREFKTPEFQGMTFYEVNAKSIINHVPGDRFGFNWTINPYRGCSHACTYCLGAETPLLMGDGRTRAISEVAVGDVIYGTVREGNYRRYVKTEVLAHWQTVKPAYRLTLEDGTELVASADHRFLSNRGWKYVIGAEQGPLQRPFLTTNNSLLGTGKFASPPKHTEEYRKGYLCGMVRGDGNVGTYSYPPTARRNTNVVHRFRLALKDYEGIARSAAFLQDFGIRTDEFVFSAGHKMRAIRTSSASNVGRIRELREWPERPTKDWVRGFLAGIFDAEGSFGRGILRISNKDPEIIQRITDSLRKLGFFYVLEHQANGCKVVRVIGGLREHLRFFHSVDPAITRKRFNEGTALKSDARLKVVSIEPLGFDIPMFDITTGTGDFIANGVVSHNCFARPTHTYLDFNAGKDFETKIVVKVNAVDLLRRELRKKSWRGERIAMGTNTDPYQRAEGRYKLMRGILKELNAARNPYSILTKGTLIQRDIDLISEGAANMDVQCNFSVGTVDEEVWRKSEPGTPHPLKRLEVVKKLNEAGIPCGVLMAPILPGISDSPEQLEATVRACAEWGATHISPIVLHLRPGVKEEFMNWLQKDYPHLVPYFRATYTKSNAPKDVSRPIGEKVAKLRSRYGDFEVRQHGQHRGPKEPDTTEAHEDVVQMSLDLGTPERKAPGWVRTKLSS